MRLASFLRRAALLAPALVAGTLSVPALANGRFPASGQIAVHPTDPNTVLVRATYGLLVTHDGGKSWGWICESAVGYGNVEDPVMGITADGTFLGGIFEGLSVGTPDACSWGFQPSTLAMKYVIDLSVDKVTPANALLMISNNTGQDDAGAPVFLTQLWQTADNGKTWAQAGTNLPPHYLGLTIDAAPSNPMRVYSSGRVGPVSNNGGPPTYPGVLERTDDRGGHWQELAIPGSDDTHLPYLSAVDPTNPDVAYVRLDSDPSDSLLVTKDGGLTWTTVYQATGKLNGFALSPDGQTVAIGGPMDGVLTAPASTLVFTKASSVGALCLTWHKSGGLYACASEFTDGFTAGLSTDQGKTWTPIFHLAGFCPLQCSTSTNVGSMCPAFWGPLASMLNITGCGGDAGPGSGSTSSSSGSGSSSSGGVVTKSCSCDVPGGAGEMAAGAAALSLVGLAALRGRRRRR